MINPIVYAEISIGFCGTEELDDGVPPRDFERESLPYEAGSVAGKACLAYRKHKEGCDDLHLPTSSSALMLQCADSGC